MLSIIVAMTKDGVIGKGGKLPWNLPEDLNLFQKLTIGNVVIMGRKTFEAIGKVLSDRANIVVSSSVQGPHPNLPLKGEGEQLTFRFKEEEILEFTNSLEEAVDLAKCYKEKEKFIIGGGQIYKQSLDLVDKIYVSWVKEDYDGDAYFPKIDWNNWKEVSKKDFKQFEFVEYKKS